MRVLHLIGGGDVGGAKTHVLSLLAGLKGHAEATLVSFRAGPFSDEAEEKGIDTVVVYDSHSDPDRAAINALADGYAESFSALADRMKNGGETHEEI